VPTPVHELGQVVGFADSVPGPPGRSPSGQS
jgi:hypothetical protein